MPVGFVPREHYLTGVLELCEVLSVYSVRTNSHEHEAKEHHSRWRSTTLVHNTRRHKYQSCYQPYHYAIPSPVVQT